MATILDIPYWIKERFPRDSNWTNGNCYLFAVLLREAFPDGTIVYDPIKGHFLYKYHDWFYDYKGLQAEPAVWYEWEPHKYEDPYHYQHVMRDCLGGYYSYVLE